MSPIQAWTKIKLSDEEHYCKELKEAIISKKLSDIEPNCFMRYHSFTESNLVWLVVEMDLEGKHEELFGNNQSRKTLPLKVPTPINRPFLDLNALYKKAILDDPNLDRILKKKFHGFYRPRNARIGN